MKPRVSCGIILNIVVFSLRYSPDSSDIFPQKQLIAVSRLDEFSIGSTSKKYCFCAGA